MIKKVKNFQMFLLNWVLVLISTLCWATDPYPRNPAIDIKHYLFQLELTDRNDEIKGTATLTIQFKQSIPQLLLDLVNQDGEGKGMRVSEVIVDAQPQSFRQDSSILIIQLPKIRIGEIKTVSIRYEGIPKDGLIIGENKYGDRTFFGDNWPNRARHWLPTIDHPYDKAEVDFVITAPDHYQVVANGEQVEESNLLGHRKLTHWKEHAPIATKLMVIGVAPFAVQKSGEVNHIPVSTWVFRQDRNEGFSDFAVAPSVLRYFIGLVGPFAYEKLANVQSRTRFGGMENASCIFYFEDVVNGRNEREGLIAHEIAHQWFGDAVTENDWHHVWLSEGFATYLTNIYLEEKYGVERLHEEMANDRKQIIAYSQNTTTPVIDTLQQDLIKLLNTNTYQKAGWVLHMLRRKVGDSLFYSGLRQYYAQFKNGNALTKDFRRVMETASGMDLQPFFTQWLHMPGHPKIIGNWNYNQKVGAIEITLRQIQESPFQFPLEIEILGLGGASFRHTLTVSDKVLKTSIPLTFAPVSLILDPDLNLLFEGELQAK